MMVNGVFRGAKAQALLKELTGGSRLELHDSQHFLALRTELRLRGQIEKT